MDKKQQDMIAALTDLLEKAKKGEIKAYLAITYSTDKELATSQIGNSVELRGMMEFLKEDLIKSSYQKKKGISELIDALGDALGGKQRWS